MKYTTHPPPAALRDYVEHLWTVECDGEERPGLTLKFFVNCAPCVVFQHLNGHSAITGKITASGRETCNRRHPTSFVRGPTTQPFQCLTARALNAIGVELKPHATRALLGIDATELSDRMNDLNAFSGNNLGERLLNAGTEQDRMALVAAFLTARARASRETDALVMESLQLIRDNVGFICVHSLLKRLHMSERQFERGFSRAIGIPASLYLRIMRFQEVVRLMKAGRVERLSDLAYDLGYTDQSHFIKDVREFTGHTPKRLSQAVDECAEMIGYRALIRQRILIRQGNGETVSGRAA
jgi:AraC-like DNA-binding protein